ncbi:MAG: serine hydrolase [Opitutaceae bacterium]|nr:serine hydrolase [Opitutaceae bacterium]
MNTSMRRIFVLAMAIAATPVLHAATFEWQTATPESTAVSTAKLDAVRELLAAHATKAFLVVRDDRIIYEWYSTGHSATKPHFTASMAKALVGGVSVAVALTDGRLALDDPAAKFIPQWRDDPAKARITLRQLGSHTSGIEDAEANDLPHEKLTGWKGDFWKRPPVPRDSFTLSRDAAPVISPPGAEIHYSNPGIAMLAYATTAALRNAEQRDLRTLLRERVMRPIGVPDAEWSVGYGQTVTVDGLPLVASWGGGGFTARATARVARLMLREGDWEGRQLIKREAVRAVTTDAGTPGNCGIGWWSNNDGTVAALPRDAYWGSGAQHQIVLVIPSLKVIAVRNGGSLSASESHGRARDKFFFEPLIKALIGKP